MPEKTDVYQEVTDRIIAALEKGTVPWRKPWAGGGRPRSLSTGKAYRGVNVMLLGMSGHWSPWWGTYRQIQELGGQVRKSERSTAITFWKELTKDEPDPVTGDIETRRIPMLRQFRVFSADQADGLPAVYYPAPGCKDEPIATPQAVMDAYLNSGNAATLIHDVHGEGYYIAGPDEIHIPVMTEHRSPEEYYSTAFHEISHSTGHSSRLARPGIGASRFGSHAYGKEELVAQMSASMLCAETGIDTDAFMDNSAAYIASWLQLFKDDKKLVISSAAAGQKAADLILASSRPAERELEPQLIAA